MVQILLALVLAFFPFLEDSAPRDAWIWPTGQAVSVARSFDPPVKPWLPGHRGVDLDVPVGTRIVAPADGQVIYAGKLVDRGVISIQHASGIRSTFEPVDILVSKGDAVSAGQPIGIVTAGHSPGTLHWGAKVSSDEYIDPLRLLKGKIVLKPWH